MIDDRLKVEIERMRDGTWKAMCYGVTQILDGLDDGEGTCPEPWQSVRQRLLGLHERAFEAYVMPVFIAMTQKKHSLLSVVTRVVQYLKRRCWPWRCNYECV